MSGYFVGAVIAAALVAIGIVLADRYGVAAMSARRNLFVGMSLGMSLGGVAVLFVGSGYPRAGALVPMALVIFTLVRAGR